MHPCKRMHAELEYAKIERPKVVYNESTGKYVLWGYYENGADYSLARVTVAASSTPTGPFTYHGSFQPNGNASRDMTIFKDADGQAYLFSSSDNNYNMRLYFRFDGRSKAARGRQKIGSRAGICEKVLIAQ